MTDDAVAGRMTLAKGITAAIESMKERTNYERAARLGVSPNTVARWKSGAASPTEGNLARLSRLSGLDQDVIRSGGNDA